MKLFESAFNLHESALQLRTQRMEVIAKNIANVDTPNFKARDIDFTDALAKALSNGDSPSDVKTTHSQHFGGSKIKAEADLLYTIPFNTSIDGNTVEMSVEQAKYGRAAAKYQATLRFLESDIGGIRKALTGGH
ncbi:MAG: flagellar basal body rod protein FlgB [Cellvibrionales bacterium]